MMKPALLKYWDENKLDIYFQLPQSVSAFDYVNQWHWTFNPYSIPIFSILMQLSSPTSANNQFQAAACIEHA